MRKKIKDALNFMARPRHTAAYAVLASVAILAAAYISQYVFGLDPCILCYYQRIPYFIVIALGGAAFFLAPQREKAALLLLGACGLAFAANAVIAGFHAGVEYGWWEGLRACGNMAMPAGAALEDLRAFIMSRDIVRCDIPAFVLFGISMAGFNALISLGLAMDTALLLWWNRRCARAK